MSFFTSRRFLLTLTLLVAFMGIVCSINLWRFNHSSWANQQASQLGFQRQPLPKPSHTNSFGTLVQWQDVELAIDPSDYFEAKQLTIQLNILSILLGRPSIDKISIDQAYLETTPKKTAAALLRSLLNLNAKHISITDGIAVIGTTEVHGVNIELVKNGSLGGYSVQSSAHLRQASLDIGFNYSAILSLAKDDTLNFRDNNLASQTFFKQGSVEWVGKVKQLTLSSNNALNLQFASWSSQWSQQRYPQLPNLFDFAGGLEAGSFSENESRITLLDAAVAFRDAQNIARTYALQSTAAVISNQATSGQLSVSILAEQPQVVTTLDDWQSYNFVMSGDINNNLPLLSWKDPEFRLAVINGAEQRLSHNISLKELTLDAQNNYWRLKDGDWNEYLGEQNTAGYGFGTLVLQWPTLNVLEGPTVTNRLQQPLNLLSNDMEIFDALHRLLVQ